MYEPLQTEFSPKAKVTFAIAGKFSFLSAKKKTKPWSKQLGARPWCWTRWPATLDLRVRALPASIPRLKKHFMNNRKISLLICCNLSQLAI